MNLDAKIYVAGHRGLAGSSLVHELHRQGYHNLVLKTRAELDLRNQHATEQFFERVRPEYVFDVAAHVGGLHANNTFRGEFIYDNLQIQTNIIHSAWKSGVKKLMFFGSNCVYPKDCPQPMKEEHFLTGPLEPTNQPYAIAKIAGIEMCNAYNRQYDANFISVMPASLFGPNDNYDLVNSHIIPTLIRKCHEAKIRGDKLILISGSKNRRREMIYSDDMANACIFLMKNYNSPNLINIGTGVDYGVDELAEKVKEVVGYSGDILFDTSKPDGMVRKLLDVTKINMLGWKPRISLEEGLRASYEWFWKNYGNSIT